MKKLVMIVFVLVAGAASAHSGGTDSNGCHRDNSTNTWHCH